MYLAVITRSPEIFAIFDDLGYLIPLVLDLHLSYIYRNINRWENLRYCPRQYNVQSTS